MLQSGFSALLPSSSYNQGRRWRSVPPNQLVRGRHVAAARVDNKVLLPGPNLERVPAWVQTRLEGDQVLVAQLAEQIVDGCNRVFRHAADAHVAARPPGEILEGGHVGMFAGRFDDR